MLSTTFTNPNPATGQAGTLLTTTWCQNVNDEIAYVITQNGVTLDSTNHHQLYQVLTATYAPLASPTFTGVPLVPDTDSSSNGRAIVNFESMKAYVAAGSLGYTPVHQGGGNGQGTNSVYIGWKTDGSGLGLTVDATDEGVFAMEGWVSSNYLNLSGGNVTGTFTYNGTTVATKNDVNSAITTVENWTSSNFLTDTTWNNNVNQDVRTSASPTFQTVNLKTLNFNNGGNSSIYQDTNNGDVVIHTNNGSDHFNVFNSDGSVNFGANTVTVGTLMSNGDIHTGSNNWVYTNTIGSYNGTVNVNATLQQSGQNVATQSWTNSQGFATTNWVNSNYVSDGTYNGDFSSSGNIWNFAYGNRMEPFTVVATDNERINFPQAFGGNPVAISTTPAQNEDVDSAAYNWDASGFTIRVVNRGATEFSIVAYGPK